MQAVGCGSLGVATPPQPPSPHGACTMTTTTAPATTAAGTILAIDLGKYKSVACAYDRATAQPSFDGIATGRAELLRLIDRHRPALVVIEACALAGWVHDLCAERGLTCKVANTASEAWK